MSAEARRAAPSLYALAPIHSATERDRDAVTAFMAGAGLPMTGFGSGDGITFTWIARNDGIVIGTIRLHVERSRGWLAGLAVAPAYRGEGLGSRLVDRAEQEARGLGLGQLLLFTETAPDFFTALGYRPASPDILRTAGASMPRPTGGRGFGTALMAKRLA